LEESENDGGTGSKLDQVARAAELILDGSADASATASRDFGGLAKGRAAAIARPRTTSDVRRLVAAAREHGVTLAPRARGLSQSGQSVPVDGVSVDLNELNVVSAPDIGRMSITCGAGASWRDVVERASAVGLMPKVCPLNLDLSVGGLLAVGGFGTTSHRFGVAASHVLSAEVVLGTGAVVRCGPKEQRRVYDAVVGGLGRVGIITSVELALRAARPRVRTFWLSYVDLDAMLSDMARVVAAGRADHVEGFCAATVQGLRKGPSGRRQPMAEWSFGLHLSIEFDEVAPTREDVLSDLRDYRVVHVEDDEVLPFASRYDLRNQAMRLTGAWEQPHPWFEVLLPLDAARYVIPRALEMLPLFLGDNHRIVPLVVGDRPLSIAVPPSSPLVGFAVLPTGVAPAFAEPAASALRALHDLSLDAGGKRYTSGWLFEPDADAWKRHHGEAYEALLSAQCDFDPDGVFRSCLRRL
jgi:cytokinin dehydrogenase